ncbi:MAG: uroporphyrinogen decarboxylase [Alphaproteobacteria bacterium]|nr:uroporphyrinogen decarboxylase [Alphaproteobacteria bacterium]NDC56005.1 uroporphyrinogen decarboxylase [Alphaproteobacteria bacterium]NDG03878.1 uroporphyrinogen decarboxylase [Alphaproteobacteria bacterium]
MKKLMAVLQGHSVNPPPLWLMRQAGRYLPEYRAIREKAPNFIQFCLTPDMAVPVTLQPIHRFDFDAAIIFADILLIPHALGQRVEFLKGEGPQLTPLDANPQHWRLAYDDKKIMPVFESLLAVRQQLSPEKTLIGFAGAPFTVACYMVDGHSKNKFEKTMQWAQHQPHVLDDLLNMLADVTALYLIAQLKNGADVVQLFESWAGLLAHDAAAFERFVIKPTQKIVSIVRHHKPDAAIIGFPRLAHERLEDFVAQTGVNAVGLSSDVPSLVVEKLCGKFPLQGWLPPEVLVQGGQALQDNVNHILDTMRGKPHIFNLGHGITPETPIEHVQQLVKQVREFS